VAFGASIVRVNGKLGWWQCENQSAVSGIHRPEPQNVAKKGARTIRVLAEQNRVNSIDHNHSSFRELGVPE